MDDSDVLVTKINDWVNLQKRCAKRLNRLADELEKAVKAANVTKVVSSSVSVGGAAAMTAAGVLTVLTGGMALPVLATVGAVGFLASGTSLLTSVGSEAYSASKTKDIMKEAKDILDELQSLEQELKDLMKSLKGQAFSSCDDDDDDDANIMEALLRSEAKRHGLSLSHGVSIRKVCGFRQFNISRRIIANEVLLAAIATIIVQALLLAARQGGKKVASSVGKKAASAAVGCAAGAAVGLLLSVPELVSDCQNLDNNETAASKTLRKNATDVRISAEETEEELRKIREALQKLARIKFIIQKKNRSQSEKDEFIKYAIEHSRDQVVKEWLIQNAESVDFFYLVDLFYSIQQRLNEEWEKKKKKKKKKKILTKHLLYQNIQNSKHYPYLIKEKKKKKKKKKKNWERKKIELIFLAHGAIENSMIPAICLLPLMSIRDVLLYSTWNCLLSAEAAYSIATGDIQPQHRIFGCSDPSLCPNPDIDHQPISLPNNWNSMRNTGVQPVPNILVSPVGAPNDKAFEYFIALENDFGAPAANRYLIPYLHPGFGRVPFFVVTLVSSLVLFLSGYEATIHLAACLGKSPSGTRMEEEYLKWQYAYTVDNTGMTVPSETICSIHSPLFKMFRAVFGDVFPSFTTDPEEDMLVYIRNLFI